SLNTRCSADTCLHSFPARRSSDLPVQGPDHKTGVHQALPLDQVLTALLRMELIAIKKDGDRTQVSRCRPEYKIRPAGELHTISLAQVNLRLHGISSLAYCHPIPRLAMDDIRRHPDLLSANAVRATETGQRFRKACFQLTFNPGIAGQRTQRLLVLHPLVLALNDVPEHLQDRKSVVQGKSVEARVGRRLSQT